MRKHFLGLLRAFAMVVVLAGATSCEKMNVKNGESDGEGVNVSLRVTSFEQVPFGLSRTRLRSVEDVCSRLNYLIYDSDGHRLKQTVQEAGDEDFGQTSFNLGKGHYLLVVLAHSSSGNPTSTNATKIGFTNTTGFTDTFYYADSLFVTDSAVKLQLNLNRIVAKVRFIASDAAPATTSGVAFYYTGGSGALDATNDGWGSVKSEQLTETAQGTGRDYYDIYTIPRKDCDHLWMRVNAFKGDDLKTGTTLSDKVLDSIPIKRNHVTICRGFLFSPVYEMTYTLMVDDEWDSDTIDFQF